MNASSDPPSTNPQAAAAVKIRPMTVDDVARGMELKQAAGWNQTSADWRRFLALEPDCCFVATADGLVIGTIASCLFDSVAWVGMMLVDARFRRIGVATRLLKHVLIILDQRQVASVRLDATPLGLNLYDNLGFQRQCRVIRFGGVPQIPNHVLDHHQVIPYQPDHLPHLLKLDEQITQIDRTKLLRALLAENAERSRVVKSPTGIAGFVIERPGSHAIQIGPVMALSEPVGRSLILDVLQRHPQESCYVDIPESHRLATSLAQAVNLVPQRDFTRMYRGCPCQERAEQLWAGSGPEKG